MPFSCGLVAHHTVVAAPWRILVVLWIDDWLATLVDDLARIDFGLRHVPDQIRRDTARMHREGTDILTLTDRVQRYSE